MTTVFAVQGENEYRKAVQNINREIKEANSALKLLNEQYRGQEDSAEALQDKLKTLTDLYGKQAEKVGKIEEALGNAQDAAEKYANKGVELRDKLQRNAEEMAKLAEAGQKASDAYKNLKEEDEKLEKALADNDAKYDAAQRGVSDWKIKLNDAKSELLKTKAAMQETSGMLSGTLVPEFKESEDKIRETGDAFGDFRSKAEENMDAVASVVTAAGVDQAFDKVMDAMQACIDKSMEFESAMTGVFKTVDMTLEKETQLAADIRQMAEEIPVSTTEIAGVAELAGQLGISNDALLDFTETMVKLGTATNLTAEDAAEALAKIANIAGTSEGDYGRLGSTVVALGNNFATTEADIVNMATRIAATGEVVGLTEAQIFAMATALSSVGIEAEAGGSAISKLLKEIETSVVTYDTAAGAIERTGYSLRDLELIQSNNSKGFKAIADELGLTSTELGRYIDTVKNLNKYAEISGQSADEFKKAWGQDAVVALDQFITGLGNIDETGGNAVETLQEMGLTEIRLSNAVLALSASGGILTKALNIANDAWRENTALTDEAAKRFETTESKVQILKNSFDNLLIAVGDDYLTTLKPAIDGLTDLTQALSQEADEGPALASTLAGIGGALGGLTGLTTAAAGIKLVSGALKVFGSAGGIAAIGVTALTGLAAGVTTYITNVTAVSDAAQQVIDKNNNLVEAYGKSKQAYEEEIGAISSNRQEVEKLIEKVIALSDEVNKTPADEIVIQGVVDRLNELLPGLGLTYDGVTEKINLTRDAMQKFAEETEQTAKIQAFENYLNELTGSQVAMQVQMDITSAKIQEAEEKHRALYEQLQKETEGYNAIEQALKWTNPEIRDLVEAEMQAKAELDKLRESQLKIQEELKNTNSELSATQDAYNAYMDTLDKAAEKARTSGEKAASEYAKALAEGAGAALISAEKLAEAAMKGLEKANTFEVGKNFATGFAKGIEETGPHAASSAAMLGKLSLDKLKTELDEHSPSRKARQIGKFFGEGLALGLDDSETDVAAAIRNLSTEFEIAPEIADKFRSAQAEIGKFRGNTGGTDPATQYRDSMAQIDRMAAQAGTIGRNTNVPVEITVVTELDGEVIARKVSRIQYSDARITMRSSGIKK